jgi:hypothetical protein
MKTMLPSIQDYITIKNILPQIFQQKKPDPLGPGFEKGGREARPAIYSSASTLGRGSKPAASTISGT